MKPEKPITRTLKIVATIVLVGLVTGLLLVATQPKLTFDTIEKAKRWYQDLQARRNVEMAPDNTPDEPVKK